MNYEQQARSVNKSRRARNEDEIPIKDLIEMLKKSELDIAVNEINSDEKRALQEFRKMENERAISETPSFIKFIWFVIFSAALYFIFK